MLNSVLLSHDGFIVSKTVNTWKKEASQGLPWALAISTPGSWANDKSSQDQESRHGLCKFAFNTLLYPNGVILAKSFPSQALVFSSLK